MDTIPYPLFYKDAQGHYAGFNKAYGQAFGVDTQTLIGKTVLELPFLPEAERQQYHEENLRLIRDNSSAQRETQAPFADGLRITSYNVCYTKLLRHAGHHHAVHPW